MYEYNPLEKLFYVVNPTKKGSKSKIRLATYDEVKRVLQACFPHSEVRFDLELFNDYYAIQFIIKLPHTVAIQVDVFRKRFENRIYFPGNAEVEVYVGTEHVSVAYFYEISFLKD